MKKLTFTLLMALFALATAHAQILKNLKKSAEDILGGGTELSTTEIGQGLKDALSKGVEKGVNELSATDGYFKNALYKILLPEEAQKVVSKLKAVPGFSNLEADLIEKMNRGAENAAKEAGPIFASAIKSMTIQDAMDILMGADNSATVYLQKTTQQQLYEKFNPVIVNALDEIGANDLWRNATTAYNKIPLVTKVNTDLDDHVTNKALDGMFGKIQEKEKDIRRNPVSRTSDLLKKVFAKQDSNRQ
ncbi:MAG: DUF4197 domain-containing protein [Bacteroidetes bacterium]|nr:MAG: DUF4197 domain-containing protein [Bacteroidota bacterium]